MQKILTVINTALIVVLLIISFVGHSTTQLGGVTGYSSINLTPQNDDTYALAVNGTSIVSTSGVVTANTLGACSSATTWNPVAVSTTTLATLDVAVPGTTLNSIYVASLGTSTRNLILSVFGTSTATATVQLSQPDFDAGAAVDIATTTVRVCGLTSFSN